jgi:hypothetical protein
VFDDFTVSIVIVNLNNLIEVLRRSRHTAVIGDIIGNISGVVSGVVSCVISGVNSDSATDWGKDQGRLLRLIILSSELLFRGRVKDVSASGRKHSSCRGRRGCSGGLSRGRGKRLFEGRSLSGHLLR